MKEKEKMLNQAYYLGFDPELLKERKATKDSLFHFNNLLPSNRQARASMIKELFGSCGDKPWIESPFNCDYGSNIHVGDNFYANNNCTILDCATVTIGDNVMFGPNVSLYTPNHPLDASERQAGYEQAFPITIGHNVWLGGPVTVTPGVSIGDNSVIAAGSVVTKDIPANVIAAGLPCRVLRPITDADKRL